MLLFLYVSNSSKRNGQTHTILRDQILLRKLCEFLGRNLNV